MRFTLVTFGLLAQATLFAQSNDDQKLKQFLKGLVYIGQFPAKDVEAAPVVEHGVDPQKWPKKFLPGVRYVFHVEKTEPAFTWDEVRRRLARLSLPILKGPKHFLDLAHLMSGGPLYVFEARQSGRNLIIYNQTCGLTMQRIADNSGATHWNYEDIIIMVK